MKYKKKKISKVRKTLKKRVHLISNIEEFYKKINQIQISEEESSFSINKFDASMYDNILKDLNLSFNKIEKKSYIKYNVSPCKSRSIESQNEIMENFPDEIVEDGEIFF